MKKLTKDWLMAALIRAIRTFAQTALSMLAVGMAFSDVDWVKLISISSVAAIISILTSIVTGLPESNTHGTIIVDTSDDAESALVGFKLDGEVTPEKIADFKKKGIVNFRVM